MKTSQKVRSMPIGFYEFTKQDKVLRVQNHQAWAVIA